METSTKGSLTELARLLMRTDTNLKDGSRMVASKERDATLTRTGRKEAMRFTTTID